MATYHLDCFSGIAGDMFLGACLDLGLPLEALAEAVAALDLPGVAVESRRALRGGLAGTRFRVLENGRPVEGPDPEEAAPVHGAHSHEHHHGEHHHHEHQHGEHHHSHAHPHEHQGHGHSHPHEHPHGAAHGHAHDHEHSHHEHGHHEHGHHEHSHHEHSGRPHDHGHSHAHAQGRNLAQIRQLIGGSRLSPAVRDRALALFERLGRAEAKMHGIPLDHVHFHEVGAVDSIVDLVGAAAAIELLAPERLTAGPVNVGGGRVRTAHGELPVPAPATAELLSGIPIFGSGEGELTTPTGAVLLAELVDEFTELPPLVIEDTGYGLGKREVRDRPNALRLLRGRAAGTRVAAPSEVMVLECEVDNLPGEGFGFLMERLLGAGALDVYFTPVQMKKNRPGSLITALCRRPRLEELAQVLLAESGSLGCRFHAAGRFEAERDTVEVATRFGTVRIKRGRLDGHPLAAAPEFEDCRRLALAHGVPWRDVYRAALEGLAAAGLSATAQ
ncbi:MAG TPA: nickel pincer cofactor biosynthesis protein LarC [Thermoanaerobaculia bacterium]|nr:nickel pincer cofactor biosynthesis protein LarC [Thermoanaerobaculia bacterium]